MKKTKFIKNIKSANNIKLLAGILFIVLIFLLAGYKYSEATEPVFQSTTTTTSTIKLGTVCTDTDGGINYNVKGTAEHPAAPVGYKIATDRCVNNITLREYYCEKVEGKPYDWILKEDRHNCTTKCVDGACMNEQPTY